ncbi:18931_t:CDS:2, partial [Racocetra persica]
MIKSSFKPSPFKPPARIPLKPSNSDNIPNTSQEKKVKPLTSNRSKRIKVNNDSADDENTYRSESEDPEDENRMRKIPKNDNKDSSDTDDTDTSLPSAIRCTSSFPALAKLYRPFKPPTFTNPSLSLLNQGGIQKKRPGWGHRHVVKRPLFDPYAPDAINETRKKVHVVVDPILGKKLRPHQVEGVK